jgi:hypothetical protein
MKFRYIAAYLVEGLQSPADGPLLLFSDAQQGKKVFLTGYTHDSLNHIDSVHTIGIALTAMFRGEAWDPNQFGPYLAETQQDRIRRYGDSAAFLVVEASHEADAASIGTIGQSEDRDYCLAITNGFKDAARERHKHFLDQSQIFLSFAMPSVAGFEETGSCIVADHPSGKPLYVLSASMTGRLSLSSPIPEDGPEQFATLFQHSGELDSFQTVFRLSACSASNARDNLRAYLFAFTALEVFVCKCIHWYKTQLEGLTERDHSPKIHTYIERLRQRKEEHVLSYKFALIASFLALDNLDETITKFDQAKKCRNDIVHGAPFDEAALPIDKVRNWLGELMRLHLARVDPVDS